MKKLFKNKYVRYSITYICCWCATSRTEKIDEFIAKSYPVSLIKIRNKTILEMIIENAKINELVNLN